MAPVIAFLQRRLRCHVIRIRGDPNEHLALGQGHVDVSAAVHCCPVQVCKEPG